MEKIRLNNGVEMPMVGLGTFLLKPEDQEGNIIIPGSKNPEHIKENADIFDFELTNEEMKEISKINKNTRYYIPNPDLLASYATMELDPKADI